MTFQSLLNFHFKKKKALNVKSLQKVSFKNDFQSGWMEREQMLHEFEIMLAAMRISNGKWYLNNANIAQEGGWHWLSPESQLQAPGTRGGDS